jgi:uncharacterized membrane protein YedE/YeeE
MTRTLVTRAGFGLALGYALTRIGFADFEAVHQMFLLTDLRLIFTFAGGVALTFLGFRVFASRVAFDAKLIHPGLVPGAVLFGAGWALTGACPGVVLVQLGAGQLLAGLTLVGLLIGNVAAGLWQRRTGSALTRSASRGPKFGAARFGESERAPRPL